MGSVLLVVLTFASHAEKLYVEPGQRLSTCCVKKTEPPVPAFTRNILPLELPVWSVPTAQSPLPEF